MRGKMKWRILKIFILFLRHRRPLFVHRCRRLRALRGTFPVMRQARCVSHSSLLEDLTIPHRSLARSLQCCVISFVLNNSRLGNPWLIDGVSMMCARGDNSRRRRNVKYLISTCQPGCLKQSQGLSLRPDPLFQT